MAHILRPYQVEIGHAVLESVLRRRGLTFTVEIARQGGKNELSAQLELLLLTLAMRSGGNLVKCAPTFTPQVRTSIQRLTDRLRDAGYGDLWHTRGGYTVCVGRARQLFFSAEPTANVVGATAHHLLEVDEAQDVEKEKFYKEFRPMGASSNVTTVLYGTPWRQDALLEEMKQANLELERRDGVKRHFSFDWQEVARLNPLYGQYVEQERQRLGEDHPLFRTQYLLETVNGGGGLLSATQRAQLQGHHPRLLSPRAGQVYVAGIDLAGGYANEEEGSLGREESRRDSTVVTVGELDFSACDAVFREPAVRVVQHYWWTGVDHATLYPQLADLLKSVWHCRRVVVDATGLGQGMASLLERALGRATLSPFTFTAASKSRLGFNLLSAINGGRLKMYAPDSSPEHRELWRQVSQTEQRFRANRTMDFGVPPSRGHDDFVMSLALLVEGSGYLPRSARGRVAE
ncbi:MAG: hypothetical protein HYY00_07245 [Chloroflexi bacterium]|nr:hypothetical protein [Chloroflexota bacterium]